MLQVYNHNGSCNQGSNGSCGGSLYPVASHYIWEKGTGSPQCEAEHQDGYDALCVEQGDEHGGHTHQAHDNLGHPHDGLAGGIRL